MFPKRFNVNDWDKIHNLLERATDIDKKLCRGCPVSKLYDKNGVGYTIRRGISLIEVEEMIIKIREINQKDKPKR